VKLKLPEIKSENMPSFSILTYALITLLSLIIYGIIGSMYLMHLDIIDALYFTIITIATVGFGDIVPVTPIQRLFTVTLVLGGVGLIAYVFTLAISVVIVAVEEITSGSKMKKRIAATKNHFVLCGYGRVGAAAFREIMKRNLKVIIVEQDKGTVEKELWEDPDVLVIHGDATDESTLIDAGIKRARGVIITTGDDVDNLFITLAAREIHPGIWIVARASKRENIKRLHCAGANKVILPEVSGGEDMYFAAVEPTMMKITEIHSIENLIEDIRKETEIILKHGCTLENIEYHLLEFREPLKRKIGISKIDELNRFLDSLDRDASRKQSLERIYESVSGIHSHWISGPDRESLCGVVNDLKKEGFLLGVNLNKNETREMIKKHGRIVEVIIKPEIKITESHMVEDIGEEAEVIMRHGCTIEDIEYYPPEFREPLHRKIGVSKLEETKKFLHSLSRDRAKIESLERLYALSSGIHSHRIQGPDNESLSRVVDDLKKKGFLLGADLSNKEINDVIRKYSRVFEVTVDHGAEKLDDKRIMIMAGGHVIDSKHYLPGIRQIVTRRVYFRSLESLKKSEEELEISATRRSLETLYRASRYIHSHYVFVPDAKAIKKIEKELSKKGILVGINLPDEKIWRMVEKPE
jgi:voltage-gated potassium channel